MGSQKMQDLTSMMSMSAFDEEEEDDDWEKEDPNLLNNPELLYKECAKLPIPDESSSRESDDFHEAVNLIRELILEHNFILEALSKRDEFHGSTDEARVVVNNLIDAFERDCSHSLETLCRYQNMTYWNDAVKNKIFSSRGTERVIRWKDTLNLFLESYLKIKNFIPKDSLEENEEGEIAEKEKEECKYLPAIKEELEKFLISLIDTK